MELHIASAATRWARRACVAAGAWALVGALQAAPVGQEDLLQPGASSPSAGVYGPGRSDTGTDSLTLEPARPGGASSPALSRQGATGQLLDDLRSRAGIAAPGAASRPVAAGRRAASGALEASADPGAAAPVELDPEVKEALKSARDWMHDTLPAGDARVPGAVDNARSMPASTEEADSAAAAAAAEATAGATARERMSEDEAARADDRVTVLNLLADTLRGLRELASNPLTWVALTLLLVAKVAFTVIGLRQRRSGQRRHRHRRSSHTRAASVSGAADAAAPPPPAAEPPRRSRNHRSRHRQRQSDGQP